VLKGVLTPEDRYLDSQHASRERKKVASGTTFIENGYVNQFRHQHHSGPATVHFEEPGPKRKLGVSENANE
jgi:hypothetical protein